MMYYLLQLGTWCLSVDNLFADLAVVVTVDVVCLERERERHRQTDRDSDKDRDKETERAKQTDNFENNHGIKYHTIKFYELYAFTFSL